jgi:hypothetical protein
MGLLEYQALPSLRDVAHDGWLCTFTIKQQLKIPSARSWAAPVRATGTARQHVQKSHLPDHSPAPPARKVGRRIGLAL